METLHLQASENYIQPVNSIFYPYTSNKTPPSWAALNYFYKKH
jgi:hypothetical protein